MIANYVFYFPISTDSSGKELAFYSGAIKGRFQIIIQEGEEKRLGVGAIWNTLDPRLSRVAMKHVIFIMFFQ